MSYANRLIEDAYPLVDKVVWQFATKIPPHVEREELRGVASVALVKASRTFDATKGAAFQTHAWRRMSGAILDYLRDLDPNSRAVRRAIKQGVTPTRYGREVVPVEMCELREDIYGRHDDLAGSVAYRLDALNALRVMRLRDATVLMRRACGFSGRELAREMMVSDSRVSQIESAARRRFAELVAA